jgi:hypothetical protein
MDHLATGERGLWCCWAIAAIPVLIAAVIIVRLTMDGLALYQFVVDFGVPGLLFLGLLYQTNRVRELEKRIDETRALVDPSFQKK